MRYTGLVEGLIGAGVIACLGALMWGLALLAKRVRRRGGAGKAIAAAMAAYDEGLHVTAHTAYVEMQAQKERSQQAPSPGKRRR